ncbi:MAG TPA: serine/threonine-protein kinase [Candidatus Krumholzibacteria bacterium]|nr:serine/threonine-protein kinase [Candidatus Krumholzibacteria bacterium]
MQAVLRIAGYDSFEQIAVGGMAVVFKARKLSVKKTVAIKVLLPHLAADARFITRFQQEAEAAARIQHDNIVNVIDSGKSDGAYFIVMEYYDGLTVEELLSTQARLPIDVALSVVLNVCYGLEAAHAQNLVHRDIKPANIIFTRQGGIKVADFGLAKAIDKLTLVTHAGKVVGTPAYMSPEQTRGEAVGTASDIFSLGVVAYEMLAAKRPFEGASYSEVVDRIQHVEPQAVASFNPLVEEPFEQIVRRMLAKPLNARYAHASEIVMDLEEAMDKHGLRRDRRGLEEFFKDPAGYTQKSNTALLARLHGETPRGPDRNRGVGVRHYRKILFLNPDDEAARAALEKMGENASAGSESPAMGEPVRRAPSMPAADPNADYRVILETIDRSIETPDTFALKLSIRLKSPVVRMRQLVSRAPVTMAQRLPYKKARWLMKVIEELGGTARLEVVVDAAPVVDEKPAPATSREIAKPLERRSPSGGILCPRCGWEEEPDARFCSLCLQHFNKTDKIDAPNFATRPGFDDPNENPLSEGEATRAAPAPAPSPGLPRRPVLIAGAIGVAAVVVLLVLLLGR